MSPRLQEIVSGPNLVCRASDKRGLGNLAEGPPFAVESVL